MRLQDNHLYVGNNDRLPQWANMPNDEDGDKKELSPENEGKIIEKIRELIKNYLQLDSVNSYLEQDLLFILVLPVFRTFQNRQKRILQTRVIKKCKKTLKTT